MRGCQSVVCGPIHMCKHSVALCVRFIGSTQCNVYVKWWVCCKRALCSGCLQFWTSRSFECLNCTPRLSTAWVLWECIGSVRRLPSSPVSWSSQLLLCCFLRCSCCTPALHCLQYLQLMQYLSQLPWHCVPFWEKERCVICYSQEFFSSFGLLFTSACRQSLSTRSYLLLFISFKVCK